jgi:hypothetical protein
MTQTTKIKDQIIELVNEYITLTHQYKISNSPIVWTRLALVEEQIDSLRVELFKLDKVANMYLNNKHTNNVKSIFSRFN